MVPFTLLSSDPAPTQAGEFDFDTAQFCVQYPKEKHSTITLKKKSILTVLSLRIFLVLVGAMVNFGGNSSDPAPIQASELDFDTAQFCVQYQRETHPAITLKKNQN